MSETRFPTKSHAAAPPCRTTRWWDECGPQEERVARLSCRSHVKRRIRSVEALHTISSPDPSDYYVYGPGGTPIEQVNQATGTATYLYTDQLGSVVMEADQSGAVTGTRSFTAYGSLASRTGSIESPFGFAGGYTDVTGLIYLVNRYYDPSTGQFVSVDLLVGVTGEAYSYCGGNPANRRDPSGADWVQDMDNLLNTYVQQASQDVASQWANIQANASDALNAAVLLWTLASQGFQPVPGLDCQAQMAGWRAYEGEIANLNAEIAGDLASIETSKLQIGNDIGFLHELGGEFAQLANFESTKANYWGNMAVAACVIGVADAIGGFVASFAAEAASAVAEGIAHGIEGGEGLFDIKDCYDALP